MVDRGQFPLNKNQEQVELIEARLVRMFGRLYRGGGENDVVCGVRLCDCFRAGKTTEERLLLKNRFQSIFDPENLGPLHYYANLGSALQAALVKRGLFDPEIDCRHETLH